MLKKTSILVLAICILNSCRKDPAIVLPDGTGNETSTQFTFSDCKLLDEPINGWRDSTKSNERDVDNILLNPLNDQELNYTAGGQLYYYNALTKVRIKIHNDIVLSPGTPSINKNGWITFNNSLLDVCVIKYNGDSLKVLSSGLYPRWDNTNENVYYFYNSNTWSINYRTNQIDSISNYVLLGVAKTSKTIISLNAANNELFSKNLQEGKVTIIRTGLTQYNSLTFNEKDEFIYWWNTSGIFQLDLFTKKTDTLFKSCPSGTPTKPANPGSFLGATNISPNTHFLCFVYKEFIAVTNSKRYTKAHAIKMDLITKQFTEIKLFE